MHAPVLLNLLRALRKRGELHTSHDAYFNGECRTMYHMYLRIEPYIIRVMFDNYESSCQPASEEMSFKVEAISDGTCTLSNIPTMYYTNSHTPVNAWDAIFSDAVDAKCFQQITDLIMDGVDNNMFIPKFSQALYEMELVGRMAKVMKHVHRFSGFNVVI